MYKKYRGKLLCFSPPVMLATFIIEFGMAFYTLWRYKMSTISRLAFVTFIALGTFQLAEYMVCGGLGWTNVQWAKVGYGAITLLPPLGIHILVAITGKKMPILVGAAYATSAAFIWSFLIVGGAVGGQTCNANYAVFNIHSIGSQLFGLYYYGWLAVGIGLALYFGNELPTKRKTLMAMVTGYLIFIVPTIMFNIIDPSSVRGIPSIMCGFAVLFAFTLMSKVLPDTCEVIRQSNNWLQKIFQRISNS